jgi:photosystem II stability/assembly factor-like uncharacterized protein
MLSCKKVISILFIIFIFSLPDLKSQTSWLWKNPYPSVNSGDKSFFLNESTGWLFGNFPAILRTTNLGANWTIISTESIGWNYFVSFINLNTGWIVNKPGSTNINKTTDGGLHWNTVLSLDYRNTASFMRFFNINDGILNVNYANDNGQAYPIIYRTTNGGINWSSNNSFSGVRIFNEGFFINESTGWLVGKSLHNKKTFLYKTTDSGSTFNLIYENEITQIFENIHFIHENTGWGIIYNNIYKTTNGGCNWYAISEMVGLSSLNFLSNSLGYANDGNNIYKSTDGGFNWISCYGKIKNCYGSINILSANKTFYVNPYQIILTTNNGITWEEIKKSQMNDNICDFCFINANTGWATGSKSCIYKTTNGGDNWYCQNLDSETTYLWSVKFKDENTGIAVGNTGKTIRTTDGGLHWVGSTIDSNFVLRSIDIKNPSKIFCTGTKKVFFSTNFGQSWEQSMEAFNTEFSDIQFLNNSTGYLTGYQYSSSTFGVVYKTTNGGDNWQQIYFKYGSDFYTGYFANMNTGWIGGNGGKIYKTTNGGVNWNICFSDTLGGFFKIRSGNAFNVCAAGYDGRVLISTNGGTNWNKPFDRSGFHLHAVEYMNENICWVGGSSGQIIKTTNAGIVFASINSNFIPKDYSLYQNFPNPFNPSTNIKYQIANNNFVIIKVFDILGKEIATLVNEKQSPGIYEVTWNASEFPSGVYFYQLSIDNGQFLNKKMILLK